MEKPSGEALHNWKGVSKNSTEQNPFEASMGIYVFKREALVPALSPFPFPPCPHFTEHLPVYRQARCFTLSLSALLTARGSFPSVLAHARDSLILSRQDTNSMS